MAVSVGSPLTTSQKIGSTGEGAGREQNQDSRLTVAKGLFHAIWHRTEGELGRGSELLFLLFSTAQGPAGHSLVGGEQLLVHHLSCTFVYVQS